MHLLSLLLALFLLAYKAASLGQRDLKRQRGRALDQAYDDREPWPLKLAQDNHQALYDLEMPHHTVAAFGYC